MYEIAYILKAMRITREVQILGGSVLAACMLVGGAYAATRPTVSERIATAPALVTTPTDTSWRASVDALLPQQPESLEEYRAPKELPPSEAIAQELIATYLSKAQYGVFTANDARETVETVLTRNTIRIEPSRIYRAEDLRISDTLSFLDYTGSLTKVMSRASQIEEHELKTFSRSVGEGNAQGSPALKRSADVYASIATDLAALTVPTAFAPEHLAALNAVTSLAHVTQLMSAWNGDPLYALAYIDAFVKTERESKLALGALYRKLAIRAKTL